MYGSGDEPLHPVLGVLSALLAALVGLAFGIGAFFIGTVFPAMLRTALPGMTDTVFLALWIATLAIPTIAFARVLRRGKGLGARMYAGCGLTVMTLLFAGELTGTVSIYPWHARMYIVPAPVDRTATTPLPR